jgi:hypothetical protein
MTRHPLYRRLGGPQARSGWVRKTSPQPAFDPRTVQPVTSRCTAYAILTHENAKAILITVVPTATDACDGTLFLLQMIPCFCYIYTVEGTFNKLKQQQDSEPKKTIMNAQTVLSIYTGVNLILHPFDFSTSFHSQLRKQQRIT